jgi:F-type H+-transporting ATPase subunit epsilon
MATTQFELVTPAKTLFSGQAEMIVCRTVDGEIAFLANHMPYIGALDPCVVRVVGPQAGAEPGAEASSHEPEVRVAVQGGFVEVKDNRVIMLADVAELGADVDVEEARRDEASASPDTGGNDAQGGRALRWAQVRLEAAQAG